MSDAIGRLEEVRKLLEEQADRLKLKWSIKSLAVFESILALTTWKNLNSLKEKLENEDRDFYDKKLSLQGCEPMTCGEFVKERLQQVESIIQSASLNPRAHVGKIRNANEMEEMLEVAVEFFFLVECNVPSTIVVFENYEFAEDMPNAECIAKVFSNVVHSMGIERTTLPHHQLKAALKDEVSVNLFYSSGEKVTNNQWTQFISGLKPESSSLVIDSQGACEEFVRKIAEEILEKPDIYSSEREARMHLLFDRAILTNDWLPDYSLKSELWLAALVYCDTISRKNKSKSDYTAKSLAVELLNFMENNHIFISYKHRTLLGGKGT